MAERGDRGKTLARRRTTAPRTPQSPRKWQLDHRGRPTWIAASPGMRWAEVFEWQLAFGNALRLEMPAMPLNGGDHRNGAVAEREQVGRLAAGLHDVWRCSHEYVSRQLRLTKGRANERKAGKQLAREGRVFLHEAGLLPWAAFDQDGSLPKGWWREDAFLSALGACVVEPESAADEALEPGGANWAAMGVAAATGVVNLQLRAARLVLRRTGMGF